MKDMDVDLLMDEMEGGMCDEEEHQFMSNKEKQLLNDAILLFNDDKDNVQINKILKETEKALLVELKNAKPIMWIPKSILVLGMIPDWFVKDNVNILHKVDYKK